MKTQRLNPHIIDTLTTSAESGNIIGTVISKTGVFSEVHMLLVPARYAERVKAILNSDDLPWENFEVKDSDFYSRR